MLNRLYLSKLLFSSLLVCSSLYAGTTKCEDCHDSLTKNSAALHYTISKPNSPETKYWDDYIHSGTKDITVYIRDLSRKDAQAALWFITTGGKHGFAARQATAQERIYLEDAIKQVALSYSSGANSGRGLQEWSQVSTANHAGHLHLQMIYKQIDALKGEVNNLNIRVNLLEKAKEEGIAEIKRLREESKQVKLDSDKNFNNVVQLLKDEAKARTNDVGKIVQAVKDQTTALTDLIKPMVDEIKDMAQKSETKWTAIWEDLKEEKDKVQDEVNRQKERKRHYKGQLSDYKEKEAEAKLADAVAKALRQREEEIRREREAAIEREKKADKANTDLRAGLAYLINARSSGQPNIDYDRIKALLNPNAN